MKFENSNQFYRMKSYFYVIFIFLFSSCLSCTTLRTSRSSKEKIKDYESRARNYQIHGETQRLSPPYSNPKYKRQIGIHNPSMRINYLREAKRHKKLAEQ